MEENATFWAHVNELRRALVLVIAIIALGFACAFFFSDNILSIFTSQINEDARFQHQEIRRERIINTNVKEQIWSASTNDKVFLNENVKEIKPGIYLIPSEASIEIEKTIPLNRLVMLGPLEGMMTSFKISFWVGFVGTSPIWIYLLLQFVLPALHAHERGIIAPFLALSVIFLTCGFLFAFFITIPLANQYLLSFNQELGQNLWSLANYLDYTLFLLLANAFAFEICLILLVLVHFGILSVTTMTAKRRHMIVLAFILGAILTPPDVLTQFMLALPLICLYEIAILYARIREKRKTHELQISTTC